MLREVTFDPETGEIYARHLPHPPPSRIFVVVPAGPGRFDIEIDCVAAAG